MTLNIIKYPFPIPHNIEITKIHSRCTLEFSLSYFKIIFIIQFPEPFDELYKSYLVCIHSGRFQSELESSMQEQMCSDLGQLGPVMVKLYIKLQDQDLWLLYTLLEMPLCPVLAAMETRGLTVDTQEMLKYGQLLKV